ncbi:MAG: serine/threonine protein kinase [Rhodoglobus sp.]|nr:serine/threonine protein kinase [Rhodoglobus sp.]
MNRRTSDPPQLKGFTFSQVLGSGGFSDVFLYDQQLPKRRVAVKVLLSDGLTAASQEAFITEANVMAQLSHPYIVKIYHADVSDDGRPYLIMEYCSGQNLADQYKRQPLSVVEALRTGIRLSSAIATAHAAGILHRDIKPANVLTNDYGWPALTDFGISSALEEDLPSLTTTRAALAESGSTTGSESVGMSIPWSPPEMFEDDPKPDVRSDVFSLAATIYTLLAGRTPFEVGGRSNQSLDLISRIERGAITPMERQDVPSSLLAVLRKGMATNREQRFATAVDFARALQRVELELSYSPTPIDVPNLVVPQPEARIDDNHADATRARSVTSIAAQAPQVISAPSQNVAPPAASGTASTLVAEATVIRGKPSAPAEATLLRAKPAVADTESVQPARRRRGLAVGVVVGVVLLVVAGIVAASTLVRPTGKAAETTTSEVATDPNASGPVVSDVIPTPTLVSAAEGADGSSVVFTWSNPDGVPSDTYVWQRTDGAGDPEKVPTDQSTTQIAGVSPGTKVCISVYVRRDGQLSADPLAACFP